jgi:deoxyribose-phosphate aldolase
MYALTDLAKDALGRLGTATAPAGRSQLLAVEGTQGLVRSIRGLGVINLPDMEREGKGFDLSPIIDHTLLRPDATATQVEKLCGEALEHGFASVCVNPSYVPLAAGLLRGGPVRVCAVAGFPLGATTGRQKAWEAEECLDLGASEIDAVIPLGPLRSGDWRTVEAELRLLRTAVPKGEAVLKLILEMALLSGPEKIQACRLARDTGMDFVKTSTGFASGGATEADVALMRKQVGARVGVKASGGIRSYEQALAMVKAGATRLGLSASLAVVRGTVDENTGY